MRRKTSDHLDTGQTSARYSPSYDLSKNVKQGLRSYEGHVNRERPSASQVPVEEGYYLRVGVEPVL
jgi:hypothetical protein